MRIYVSERSTDGDPHPVDDLRCEVAQTIAMVRLMLGGWLETPDDPGFNYSTLIQQAMSVIAQHGGATAVELHRALCGPGPFHLVDAARFSRLLRAMVAKELVTEASDRMLLHGAVGERTVNHYSFYAAFQTPVEWRLVSDGKTLGTVPISHALQEGALLIFAGKRWIITTVDELSRVIELETSSGGNPPRFHGVGPLVSYRVREEMVTVYESDDAPGWLDPRASELLAEGRAAWRRFGLGTTTVLNRGADVLLFPWTSDRALYTIEIALRSAGIGGASTRRPVLQVEGASVSEISEAVRGLLAQGPPDAAQLAASIANRRIDKWDWVLDDTLLRESAGTRLLDVERAWTALAGIAADLASYP